MKKTAYFKGKVGGWFMNLGEYPLSLLLHRKPKDNITVQNDLKYGEGKRETINIIFDHTATDKQPAFIYVHGGGWCSGLPKMRNTYCMEYAERGWVSANIGYEYAPKMTFPHQFKQIYKAIDWLYDHSEEYHIDMTKVTLAGESAGGYFITYMAAMSLDHTLYDKLGIDFKHRDEFKVSALVSNCGAVDFGRLIDNKFLGIKYMINAFTGLNHKEIRANLDKEEIKILSPEVKEGFPPTMLIYAKNDFLKTESFALQKRFDEIGTPYRMHCAEGILSMHAFPLATIEKRGKACLDDTVDFISQYAK